MNKHNITDEDNEYQDKINKNNYINMRSYMDDAQYMITYCNRKLFSSQEFIEITNKLYSITKFISERDKECLETHNKYSTLKGDIDE